jgi:hypothetical protein
VRIAARAFGRAKASLIFITSILGDQLRQKIVIVDGEIARWKFQAVHASGNRSIYKVHGCCFSIRIASSPQSASTTLDSASLPQPWPLVADWIGTMMAAYVGGRWGIHRLEPPGHR